MVDRLREKAAFVTGAGSGIGRATARRFAEEGAAVMAADVVGEKAAETATMITADGLAASSVAVDVTDGNAVEAALAQTVEELGGIDVVLNNAGITIVERPTSCRARTGTGNSRSTSRASTWCRARPGLGCESAAAGPSSRPRRSPGCGQFQTTRRTALPRPR